MVKSVRGGSRSGIPNLVLKVLPYHTGGVFSPFTAPVLRFLHGVKFLYIGTPIAPESPTRSIPLHFCNGKSGIFALIKEPSHQGPIVGQVDVRKDVADFFTESHVCLHGFDYKN